MSIQWPLVFFTLFAGCGSGMLVFIGVMAFLNEAKRSRVIGSLVAMVLLILGGLCSLLHLEQPANVMAAITNLGSFSGISVELMLLAATVVFALVYYICVKRKASDSTLKIIAVVGALFGLLMAFAMGNSYVMESRANWDTILLPFAYLGSNLALGAFAMGLISLATKEAWSRKLNIALFVMVAIETVSFILYPAMIGVSAFSDANSAMFWGGLIICGVVLPLVIGLLMLRPGKTSTASAEDASSSESSQGATPKLGFIGIGGVGVVASALSLRCLMWLVGSGVASFFTMDYWVL